jgi:uncharacterized protein (TIGR04255 family)
MGDNPVSQYRRILMPELRLAPVKFGSPPVVEVVCGAQFALPKPLKTAHLGGYWDTIRGDFPLTEDAAPVPPLVDADDAQSVEFLTMPPLRRAWFIEPGGRHLIQLQEDRFLFNWKRTAPGDEYPSFEKVVAGFNEHLHGFVRFLSSAGLGEPKFTMLEMSYVNIIQAANGLDVNRPWRFLADHMCREDKARFLPAPEAFSWNTSYPLPDSSGRLQVTAQTASSKASGEMVVRLELIARGRPNDMSEGGRASWFQLAHDWITQGFADVTTADIQEKFWKRSA